MRKGMAFAFGAAAVASLLALAPVTAAAMPQGAAPAVPSMIEKTQSVKPGARGAGRAVAGRGYAGRGYPGRGYAGRRGGGIGPGGAAILGLGILGVAGAIAASQQPQYYEQPAYPVYGPACGYERQPVYDRYGNYRGDRNVRVCN